MEYYSAIRKKVVLPFTTPWIYLEGTMLSEISQTGGKIVYDLTYMWKHRAKSRLVVARDSGKWVKVLKGYKPYYCFFP